MTAIEARFRERTTKSGEHAVRATHVMPGGDTRAAAHHPPYQLTMKSGSGPYLTDLDGHRYIDLIGNFTSLVHGNAYAPILEAAAKAVTDGTSWPARNESQVELAEELCRRVPSVEQIRFSNSGTEATMLAVEIARVATGRQKFIMSRWGYHGTMPQFELGTFGREGGDTLLADFGDIGDFERVLEANSADVACVIVEPVMASAGMVTPPDGFLAQVTEAAHRVGALMIFDEVVTLRMASGGAQSTIGVSPDLTAMAKIIGGGFPVGAVGGRSDLMELCNPFAPKVYHSGTFNGNPVTTAAGLVSIRHLSSDAISEMGRRAVMLEDGLIRAAAASAVSLSIRRHGSLMQLHLSDEPPPYIQLRTDGDAANLFHLAALNHGVFCAGRGLVALSTVMDDDLIAETIDRLSAALDNVAAQL